ncbi:MAG: AAA family ATPase [Oscillospiraceae bacterium]|nr:AAA family ATPase [Oscillospiraceae bacterium]
MGILVCGLNGAGKSTIGKMLAARLGYRFLDIETLYFPQSDAEYPYDSPRSKAEVSRLLEAEIGDDRRFVLAAVNGNYGTPLASMLDCAVVLDVPKPIRMARIRSRSFERFGAQMQEGGNLYEKERSFFAFAERRTDADFEDWLQTAGIPVFRMDGTLPPEKLVEMISLRIATFG